MNKLFVTIITPLGKFEGFADTDENATEKDLEASIAYLIENVNGIKYLAITDFDGVKTVFNKELLTTAIIQFSIRIKNPYRVGS